MKKIIILLILFNSLFFLYSNNINNKQIKKIVILNKKTTGIDKDTALTISEILIKNIIKRDEYIIIENLNKTNSEINNDFNKKDAIKIAKQLDTDIVILGKVKKTFDEININVDWFDTATGRSIFSKNVNYDLEDKLITINIIKKEILRILSTKNKYIDISNISYFHKGFDFTIGGGITVFSANLKFATEKSEIDGIEYFSNYHFFLYANWGIFLPLSFSYFFNPKNSIGFEFKTGYEPGFYYYHMDETGGPTIFTNSIFFNLSGKNKFRTPDKKIRFLLEYGIRMNVEIPSEENKNVTYSGVIDHGTLTTGILFIGAGPIISYGIEYVNNKFSLELLHFIGATFGGQCLEEYTFYPNGRNINITSGINLKFNYYHKNYYYKKISISDKNKKIPNIDKLKYAKEGDIIIFSDILFFPDSDKIKEKSYIVLDKIAMILIERKNIFIEIGGYTNNTGNQKAELLLSVKRALRVANYFVKKGVSANRIKASGYGALHQDEFTIIEANRRVEIKILKSE